jgi:hypothetical protein
MLDELRKLPTCLTNFSAEERKLVLDALLVRHVNQGRERFIEDAKTRAREGKQLTEEEEASIRKSYSPSGRIAARSPYIRLGNYLNNESA